VKITQFETFLVNSGLRNYLFLKLTASSGLTGVGEASLEWQEQTVETILHEWVKERIIGEDPFDIERIISHLIRDQYQGGSTIMTAISAVEIALWDLIGKACGYPVFKLLGGRTKERFPAYANGWYGGCRTPEQYATAAAGAVARGYVGIKFDPFGVAHRELSAAEADNAEALVAAVRQKTGDSVKLMIEVHGRLSAGSAIEMGRRLEKFHPAWYEEPVNPYSLELLLEVKKVLPFPIAAGERLYALADFFRLVTLRAADVVQMDIAHCGGLLLAKKIASMADVQDLQVSPHCSIGPVALCAALHFGWSTPNVYVQEYFGDYDVPWRDELVCGWNPIRCGEFVLPHAPGLGLELNTEVFARYPYRKNSFPSLWDSTWLREFTKGGHGDRRPDSAA
jgi:galactonate dehydratase